MKSLTICWQRARLSGRDSEMGHGICFYAGACDHGDREHLAAFVDGFAWLHGFSNNVIIYFDPKLVPVDNRQFAAFKTAIEAHIHAVHAGDLEVSEIVPGYWVWVNG